MADEDNSNPGKPALLDVVALLGDRSEHGLSRGHVGTVVELLNDSTALIEFTDDEGRAYAIVPCPTSALLVLRKVPEAA